VNRTDRHRRRSFRFAPPTSPWRTRTTYEEFKESLIAISRLLPA